MWIVIPWSFWTGSPRTGCTWVVGPQAVIEAVSSTGSFLDGGGSRPLQRAALPLLDPTRVRAEAEAIRCAFLPKRQILVEWLRAAGMRFDAEPDGTFYVWADLSGLPAPLNDATEFFQAALEERVICVPGEFFDINPGRRRAGRRSRFRGYARFSFGPEAEVVSEGVRRIQEMVHRYASDTSTQAYARRRGDLRPA